MGIENRRSGLQRRCKCVALCLGGVALKPYPDGDRILVEAATTDFTPTRFDGTGKAIGGVFKSKPLRQGKGWFVKMEYHDFLQREDGTTVYVIENKAFRSGENGGIGAQVPLNTVMVIEGIQAAGISGGSNQPIQVNVLLDGKVVARNTVHHINDMTRQAGKPVLLI